MNLKEKLKTEGVNMIWLAQRLGLSRPTLDKYVSNPEDFKVKHFRKIVSYIRSNERDALINYFKSKTDE